MPKNYFNFIQFDTETKLPIYTRYNFDFVKYQIAKNLTDTKYDLNSEFGKWWIFDAFWTEGGFTYDKKVIVPEYLTQYFFPITQTIIDYIDAYAYVAHFGYLANIPTDTLLPDRYLVANQFNLIYFNDDQIRKLQDYYYDDANNIYSKYNFDFLSYSNDFGIYGHKLLILTHFVIACTMLSGVVSGSATYGLPDGFKKYFIQMDNKILTNYLSNYGVSSVFNNTYKNLGNIDFAKYLELNQDIPQNLSLDDTKNHYLYWGQFEQRIIPFIQQELSIADNLTKSVGIVHSSKKLGSAFLYKSNIYPDKLFLVTCYHTLKDDSNLYCIFCDFEIRNENNYMSNVSVTLEFRVIGYDRISDVLVAWYDPTLSYNILKNFDISKFTPLTIDNFAASNLSRGDNIVTLGMIGVDDILDPTYGKIVNSDYSGAHGEIERNPSYLLQCNTAPGSSGSPIFFTDSAYTQSYKLIGMLTAALSNHTQYTIGINGFVLNNIVIVMIYRYFQYSKLYENNIIALNNLVKDGFPSTWLGIDAEYWNPRSDAKIPQLVNLPYTGGVIIKNFIVGYNFKTNERVYSPKFLNMHEVFEIKGPLLNTKLYKRFVDSGNVPLVLVSASYFDSCYSSNIKRYFGKFSNQEALSYLYFGYEPTGSYLNDKQYLNPVRFEYPNLTLEYYYYDGEKWIFDSEIIGGNDLNNNYVVYTDINGNKYLQHKFQFPAILLDYVETFMPHISNTHSIPQQGSFTSSTIPQQGSFTSSTTQLQGSFTSSSTPLQGSYVP
jgi:hypothetical protein